MTQYTFADILKDAEDAFKALPVGDYDVVVVEAEGLPSGGGKPMIKTKMQVLHGPAAGKIVWNNFTISPENPQAVAIFMRHMMIFGITGDFFLSLPPVVVGNKDNATQIGSLIAPHLLGKQARLTLSQREWPEGSGQFRNNVDNIVPIPGGVAGGPGGESVPTPNVPQPMPTGAAGGVPIPDASVPTPTNDAANSQSKPPELPF